MRDPRVLIVTTEVPDAIVGGLGFFHDLMWTELKRRNYPFRACYLNKSAGPMSAVADYNLRWEASLPFDSGPEAKALNEAWSMRVKMQPILDEFQPDVLSLHENWTALPFWNEMHKVQFTLHSSHIGMEHELARTQVGLHNYWEQRFSVRNARAVVLHSRWSRDMVTQHVASDARAPFIFPIGLRAGDYPEKKIRHPEGKIVASFFGRFADTAKNYPSFRKAIFDLPSHLRERIEARVYGPNEIWDSMRNEGFKGLCFVQGEAKKRALAETDIVVMPSTRESFGIVGLEALLSNCKLIATPGLGMDQFLDPSSICAPDPDSIRLHLTNCIENFNEIRSLQDSSAYRSRVAVPELSAGAMVDNYVDVWRRIAAADEQTAGQQQALPLVSNVELAMTG